MMINELFPDDEREKAAILKRFMQEHFPYADCKKLGFFTKEMRNNYEAQAKRVCDFFGYKTVYEYGAEEIRCHISYAGPRPIEITEDGKMIEEPFITVIPSIYE